MYPKTIFLEDHLDVTVVVFLDDNELKQCSTLWGPLNSFRVFPLGESQAVTLMAFALATIPS